MPNSPPKRPRTPSPDTTQRLRKLSRQQYLQRREADKLKLLRDEILDDRLLFKDEQLTDLEKQRLQRNERLYHIAVERSALLESDATDLNTRSAYRVPGSEGVQDDIETEEQEADPSTARYTLNGRQQQQASLKPLANHANWESQQIQKGNLGIFKTEETRGEVKKELDKQLDELELEQVIQLPWGNDRELIRGNTINPEQPVARLKRERRSEKEEKQRKLLEERRQLPMYQHREPLIDAVKKNQVLIVESETGSGKTTQIPQYLIEEGFGKIVCTQPRRVAAMSVAARVATEMGVKLGNEVGYSIRFEDCSSERTTVKYVTDGMLLREFLSQPDLKDYNVIIVDEAHERSLSTDIVMGLVKDIARFRGDDVRVIISSATMNTKKFSKYFDDAPVYTVPGRRYDVEVFYTKKPQADYVEACCQAVLQIHASQPKGDILVFLTGQDEIEATEEMLIERTKGFGSKLGEVIIAPIYATLPSEMQAKIFEPTPEGARKVVLATNIAETSVTIPGIVYVIDPGFCKQTSYSARTGSDSLLVVPVSRAGAKQRAGRAGRTQPGKCFRLYTKWSYEHEMEQDTVPELLRTNLSQVVLLLMSLGIENLIEFDFLDPPPTESLLHSLEHLYALGALNDRGKLTKLGRRMAELPLEPMMAKALLASEDFKCSEEVTIICAMLSVNNAIFYRPKNKKLVADAARSAFSRGGGGDHIALLNCYTQWRNSGYSTQWCFEHFVQARTLKRARDIYEQLDNLLDRVEIKRSSIGVTNKDPILKAFTTAFFYNACRLQKNGNYRTIKNPRTVQIHPSSCHAHSDVRPRWLIYHELVFTSKEFIRHVYGIEGKWLFEAAPHFYKEEEITDISHRKMPKVVGKSGAKARR